MDKHSVSTAIAKEKKLKQFSAVLLILSAAQLAVQITVFVKFRSFYEDEPINGEQRTWLLGYNGMIIASGALSLISSFMTICSSSRRNPNSSWKCVIVMILTIGLLGAIASLVLASLESVRIRSTDKNHPCVTHDGCELWFGLEVAVAVIAGLSAIVILVILIVATTKSKAKRIPVKAEQEQHVVPQGQPSGEVTVWTNRSEPSSVIVTAAEVTSAEQVLPFDESGERTALPPTSSAESQIKIDDIEERTNKPSSSELSDEMIAYSHQLRKMTHEELEREMARQFQIKFLKELRVEIDRRNLFASELSKESKRSDPEKVEPTGDADPVLTEDALVRQHGYTRHNNNNVRLSDASSVKSSGAVKRTSSSRPPQIELGHPKSDGVRVPPPVPRQPPPTPDYDLRADDVRY